MHTINVKKYILVFVITALIFFTAFAISSAINDKKVADIKASEDKISIDILSLETQFELLQNSPSCNKIDSPLLSQELNSLADKLSYAENHSEIDSNEVEGLKKYYSLLEIKDNLITKKLSEQCHTQPATILYFYSNKENCDDCQKQSYVLTYLREKYPPLRVYSFDYDLDLNAVQTLISVYKIKDKLPALVVGEKTYNGFQSVADVEKLLPPGLATTTSQTATSSSNLTK